MPRTTPLLVITLAMLTPAPASACWHADQHREFAIAISRDASQYATAKVILHRDEQYGAMAGASFYCVYRTRDGRQQGPCRLVRRYDYPADLGADIRFARAFFTDKVHDARTKFLAGRGKKFRPAYGGQRNEIRPPLVALWNKRTSRLLLCAENFFMKPPRLVCGQRPPPCKPADAACFSAFERARMLERPALLRQVSKHNYVCHAKADGAKARARPLSFGDLASVTWFPKGAKLLVRFSERFGSGNHLNHSDEILYADLSGMSPLKVRLLGSGASLAATRKALGKYSVELEQKAAASPTRGRIRVRPEYEPLASWLIWKQDMDVDHWEIKVDASLDVGLEVAPPAPPPRGHEWWGQ